MYDINVTENGQTYSAHIRVDVWDDERVTAALYDSDGSCVSVGDGACSYAALEDALWDALAERAHEAEAAYVYDLLGL